ncbi:hypothetical protein [Lacticaseibacillus zhaodongensis]|nr:hypothetical protein [Lacticaseibacillus zhaodongensis]
MAKKTMVLGIIATSAAGTALVASALALASGILTIIQGSKYED